MKKISKNILFNIFLVSFLVWVFLNNIFVDYKMSLIILVFLSICIINLVIYLKSFKLSFIYLFILIFGFSLWIFSSEKNLNKVSTNTDFIKIYDSSFNNDLKFEIKEVYKIKDYNKEYIAKLLEINNLSVDSGKDILAIVSIAKNYDIKLWDIVVSKAKVELIKNFNDFDYKNFLLSKGIYFKSYLPFIENSWSVERNIVLEKIEYLRKKSLEIIYEIYPENEAIFLAWILLGARESLSKEIKDNFNNSWLTHFIAVSGFNITILIIFFSFIFRIFPIFFRSVLIISVIILFTFLVWDTAPVIRASIMWGVAYLIMNSWRKSNNFTVLMLTAVIMSFFSPFILNYDVSFALSFLAVLWILYTQTFWKKIFKFMPKAFAIREAFILTMSAMSFTLPIMLFNFGQVSVLAPISNVLVTWTIPLAMFFWFLSIVFYLVTPIFGYIIWYLAWLFLKWDMLIVNFFWTREFSVFKYDFAEGGVFVQMLYFIVLVFLILFFRKKKGNLLDEEFGGWRK